MVQDDASFVQFRTMAYGYRAAWKILDTYAERFRRERKGFTVNHLIRRWVPPTENETKHYTDAVLRMTGLGGNERLQPPHTRRDTVKLANLLAAMTVMENGIPWTEVDRDAIWEGYDLAFPYTASWAA